MKKKLTFLLILFSFFLLPSKAENDSGYYVIGLFQSSNSDPEKLKYETPKKGDRLPSRPIECYLSLTEGVVIPTVDIPEIISYEIYDLSEACIGIFSEADDFVSFLFSQSGSFEVRFTTDEYIFVGYITL
ncbi:MAG: hypothetical protein K2H47_06150 [Muribaculaceae bacterium]|nr:hypothetical protein [Muribaculaceae bacterium]